MVKSLIPTSLCLSVAMAGVALTSGSTDRSPRPTIDWFGDQTPATKPLSVKRDPPGMDIYWLYCTPIHPLVRFRGERYLVYPQNAPEDRIPLRHTRLIFEYGSLRSEEIIDDRWWGTESFEWQLQFLTAAVSKDGNRVMVCWNEQNRGIVRAFLYERNPETKLWKRKAQTRPVDPISPLAVEARTIRPQVQKVWMGNLLPRFLEVAQVPWDQSSQMRWVHSWTVIRVLSFISCWRTERQ